MLERMQQKLVSSKYNVIAEALSICSAAINLLPDEINFIGKSDMPSYRPLRWRHLRQTFDSQRGTWVSFDGLETSGRTPRNYTAAGIILIDRERMDALRLANRATNDHDAVAYKLGTTVMIGKGPRNGILGLENERDEDYQVAMRIGRGTLVAQVGLQKNGQSYIPLGSGVRAGDILPVCDIPDTIPLI